MPIYEYRCDHCGHEFERLQKMSDPDPERCPECGAEGGVKRLISAAGFRLKGGGWYETDFKKDNRRNVAGAEDKKKTEPKGGGSDTAPASKTDAKPATDKKKAASGDGGKSAA